LILGGKGGYHLLNGGVNGSQCQCTTPLSLRLLRDGAALVPLGSADPNDFW
jgi:hypothetical protein